MNNQIKQILLWVSIVLLVAFTFNVLQNDNLGGKKKNIAFSDFLTKLDDKHISSVKIQDRLIEGSMDDGTLFSTYTTEYPDLINKLNENGVYFEVAQPDNKMNWFLSILISWFPTILIIAVWLMFVRNMQGGGKAMGFGKSKAKLMSDKGPKVTFQDVAGIDEAKDELTEIVEFLRAPSKFQKLGGKIPKGCLLIGPPGSGKTLLAKAISGEANVPFFSISGSDFVEMFVGVGASRVRDMFEQAKRNAPCLLFIDEIDAVGRHRGIGMGGGNDEREQTLNQLLVEMDGFEPNEGVIIIAATNRADILDPALMRPGRFDRKVVIDYPNVDGREQILKVHLKQVRYSDKVSIRTIARGTPRFSGAQLQNLVNEAALLAARRNKKIIDAEEFELARDKIMMGAERKWVMSEEEKNKTAYHEAGHALVSLYVPASDPIHKATILPRGQALGMVQHLPDGDETSKSLEQFNSDIAVYMGGRISEEIVFGKDKVTSGATGDIKGATYLASHMVREAGFSTKLGNVFYGDNKHDNHSGQSKAYSENTAMLIDQEIKRVVDEGYDYAKSILIEHIDELHLLAKALREHETLSGQQIKNLLSGRALNSEEEVIFPAGSNKKPKPVNEVSKDTSKDAVKPTEDTNSKSDGVKKQKK